MIKTLYYIKIAISLGKKVTLNGDYEFSFTKADSEKKMYLDVKMTEFGGHVTYEKIDD
jgi:hypothetical protein